MIFNYCSFYHILLLIIISYYTIIYFFSKKRGVKVGKPFAIPIIGHGLFLLPIANILKTFNKYIKKYGKVIEFKILNRDYLLISDLELSKEILHKRPKSFRRIRSLDYSANKLGYIDGLLHINGLHSWNRIRKITSPSLSKQNIIQKTFALKENALLFIKELDSLANGKHIIHMDKTILTYSIRVVCLAAFGLNKLKNEHSDYFFGKQFPIDVASTLSFFVESSFFPFPNWCWVLSPYYKIELEAQECDARFNKICQEIIDEKRSNLISFEEDIDNYSLIDIMLMKENINKNNNNSNNDYIDNNITNEEILANVKIFFLGGSDTTAIAITWSLFYLSQDQELINKLRDEIDFLYNNNNNNNNNEKLFEDLSINKLPLCYAIIKETLRLCSPGPIIVSETESLDKPVVMSNGLIIYPKEEIFTFLDGIFLDEEIFDNATLFNPNRWLLETENNKLNENKLKKMNSALITFGYGPRICPGKDLAMIEAVLGISSVIYHYEISLSCNVGEINRIFCFAGQPNKMPMILSKRKF